MSAHVQIPGGLVLASGSPRRKELLGQLGLAFTVQPADIDESVRPGESPEVYVRRMATEKARAGAAHAPAGSGVLAADTAVVIGTRILGKPRDRDDALDMLAALSGKTHHVYSAVALTAGDRLVDKLTITKVCFGAIAASTASAYWATGEPADKAGAYAIQGSGAVFVSGIQGSYTGVVGLPLFETNELLKSFGYATGFAG